MSENNELEIFMLTNEEGKPNVVGIYLKDHDIESLLNEKTVEVSKDESKADVHIVICHHDNKERLNRKMKDLLALRIAETEAREEARER